MMKHNLSRLVMSLGVAVVVPIASVASGQSVTVSAPTLQGAPEAELKLPISISGATDLAGMQLDLLYDPEVLEVQDVERGALLKGKNALLEHNPNEAGRLRIGFIGTDPINGDGELIQATFTVKGTPGQTTALTLENVEAGQLENMLELRTVAQNGQFTVASTGLPLWLWIAAGVGVLVILVFLMQRMFRRASKTTGTS